LFTNETIVTEMNMPVGFYVFVCGCFVNLFLNM